MRRESARTIDMALFLPAGSTGWIWSDRLHAPAPHGNVVDLTEALRRSRAGETAKRRR